MEQILSRGWSRLGQLGSSRAGLVVHGAILGLGVVLWWLSREHPALMPVWAPWDFSWPEYLATTLALFWFFRGLMQEPSGMRPSRWRQVAFVSGLLVIYAALQTRFDYMAQHMFFLNRAQHVIMHHIGPFVAVLGWPGGTIRQGMPRRVRSIVEHRFVVAAIHFVQQPVLAAFLFVGLFYFWLVPPIHFRAMLDARLYAVMNWTMVIDGFLFWSLVLDPRPKPPARVSFGGRAGLAFGVMFPQIILGAVIAFSHTDLYPYYDFCGRLFPSISALNDQHIGGIVMWIPPSMMSVLAVVLVLNALRRHEESRSEVDPAASSIAARAARWTGR